MARVALKIILAAPLKISVSIQFVTHHRVALLSTEKAMQSNRRWVGILAGNFVAFDIE